MYQKLGELKVNKTKDYYNGVAQILEEAGFALVLEYEGFSERLYSIAINMEENKDEKENEWIKKIRKSV